MENKEIKELGKTRKPETLEQRLSNKVSNGKKVRKEAETDLNTLN